MLGIHYRTEEFPIAMLLVAMDPATSLLIVQAAAQKHWATTFFDQKEVPLGGEGVPRSVHRSLRRRSR